MKNKEEWKEFFEKTVYRSDIPITYYISNKGNVKSIRYIGIYGKMVEKELKQRSDKDGYLRVWISGYSGSVLIHRIVAKYFLEDYSEELTVNHKNLIKYDNRVENIEMMTMKENVNHAWDIFKKRGWESLASKKEKEKIEMRKKRAKRLKEMNKCRNKGMKLSEIGNIYGLSEKTVWAELNYHGFIKKSAKDIRKAICK